MRTTIRTAAAGVAVAVLATLPLAGPAAAEEDAPVTGACAEAAAAVDTAKAAVVDLRKKFTVAKLNPAKVAKKLAADPTLLEGVDGVAKVAPALVAADKSERKATKKADVAEKKAARDGQVTGAEKKAAKQADRDAKKAKVAERKAALAAAKVFKKAVKAEWTAAKAELRTAKQAYEDCLGEGTEAPEVPEDTETPEVPETETPADPGTGDDTVVEDPAAEPTV